MGRQQAPAGERARDDFTDDLKPGVRRRRGDSHMPERRAVVDNRANDMPDGVSQMMDAVADRRGAVMKNGPAYRGHG